MGFYRYQVLPRLMNVLMANEDLAQVRERVASGLSGTVLEIGFGSGLNVPYYPLAVDHVLALDPATLGRQLAAERVARSHVRLTYLDARDGLLRLADESIDHILVTWTICSITDVPAVLGEARRALRPGGGLHFAEHGRSPEPKVARWQDRLNPLQRALAGGCNLDRPIDRLIEESGFHMAQLDNFYVKGLRVLNYMYEGVAIKS